MEMASIVSPVASEIAEDVNDSVALTIAPTNSVGPPPGCSPLEYEAAKARMAFSRAAVDIIEYSAKVKDKEGLTVGVDVIDTEKMGLSSGWSMYVDLYALYRQKRTRRIIIKDSTIISHCCIILLDD